MDTTPARKFDIEDSLGDELILKLTHKINYRPYNAKVLFIYFLSFNILEHIDSSARTYAMQVLEKYRLKLYHGAEFNDKFIKVLCAELKRKTGKPKIIQQSCEEAVYSLFLAQNPLEEDGGYMDDMMSDTIKRNSNGLDTLNLSLDTLLNLSPEVKNSQREMIKEIQELINTSRFSPIQIQKYSQSKEEETQGDPHARKYSATERTVSRDDLNFLRKHQPDFSGGGGGGGDNRQRDQRDQRDQRERSRSAAAGDNGQRARSRSRDHSRRSSRGGSSSSSSSSGGGGGGGGSSGGGSSSSSSSGGGGGGGGDVGYTFRF